MPEELRPCPFCGARAVVVEPWHDEWTVRCSNDKLCPVVVFIAGRNRAKTIHMWNRRADDDEGEETAP